jgi:RNA polymerase sigma-70 factor (family 1)
VSFLLNQNAYDEKALLAQAANGDEFAFSQLFIAKKDKLYSFALKLTASRQQAEDLVQDIFYAIWKHRSKLLEIENFDSYLFRSAQNRFLNNLKRAAQESHILKCIKHETLTSESPPSQADLQYKETTVMLNNIVSQLPPQQQLIFRLSRESGLRHTEIAEQLKLSNSTVKNHLVVALKKVRERLRIELLTTDRILLVLIFLFQKR